jgi:hypothetical protein
MQLFVMYFVNYPIQEQQAHDALDGAKATVLSLYLLIAFAGI